jgi:hypothetical protein
VRVHWEGAGSTFPDSIVLAPAPDAAGLARLVARLVPAAVLWAGITFVRTQQAGAVALVDPVLRAIGVLTGAARDERVIVPLVLLADPVHWLTHDTVLGDGSAAAVGRLQALLDGIAALLGIPRPGTGRWTLPYGLELAALPDADRTTLVLQLVDPIDGTGLRVAGSLGTALPSSNTPATPTARLTLALPDGVPLDGAGRVELSVGATGLAARLVLPASGIDLALLPDGPGLGALGAAAVRYALPLALDAIVDAPAGQPAHEIGAALAAVGDALALRAGGQFDGAQIQALAADPARQLAQRLVTDLHAALDALAALVAPVLPNDFRIARDANDLVFERVAAAGMTLALRLTAPAGGSAAGARLTGSLGNVEPFADARLDATLSISPAGLTEASVAFDVDPAQGAALGALTLAPLAELAVGSAPQGGRRVAVGLAVDPAHAVRGVLRLGPPRTFTLEPTGGALGDVVARLVLPLALDAALDAHAVTALLDRDVLNGTTVRHLLDGVALTGPALDRVDAGVLDPAQLWARLLRLAANVGDHAPEATVGSLAVQLTHRVDGGDHVFGVSVALPPGARERLVKDGVTVDVEVDASWITGPAAPEGVLVEVRAGAVGPTLSISVRGIGLRLGRATGPLLDTFLAVDTVALHGLAAVSTPLGVTDVGGQLELGGLRVALGASTGGTNKVASGVLRDSASGPQKPEPKFSPALAVQRHGNGAPRIDLRAGDDDGPWWVPIQRGFGPVYIEQVGFGVSRSGDQVIAARVIVDGKVSLLGMTVAVDDLALGAR